MPPLPRILLEACRCGAVWALSATREGHSPSLPEDDFVKQYEDFRTQCPDKHKTGHSAFCQRCDNSFPSTIGGANWIRDSSWRVLNPLEKFPEPIRPRVEPKVSTTLWEHLTPFIQRVPLAHRKHGAKIEERAEVTAQETISMADNEATRQLFRELLGMTDGANASGRGKMHIPDDIMDSLAGDVAQETLARDRLIMEMRDREERSRGPRFVRLDLMEMESHDVDGFLAQARKKIIKRSKPSRQVCCSKIGGILDQMLGTQGGDYADQVQADDRGKHDPLGDADEIEETYKKVKVDEDVLLEFDPRAAVRWMADAHQSGDKDDAHYAAKDLDVWRKRRGFAPKMHADHYKLHRQYLDHNPEESTNVDLLSFITEEFSSYEHDDTCVYADPKNLNDQGPMSFGLTRRPGLLREHFNLAEGAEISMDKAKSALAVLQQKKKAGTLAGKEAALLPRLAQYVKMGGDGAKNKQEEDVMQPSLTASALASFMESSHQSDRYKAAQTGSGKGSPDSMSVPDAAGQLSMRTRDDNQAYPTALAPAKGGDRRVAGQPGALSTRGKNRGNPIGETAAHGSNLSETAVALASFMEANYQYVEAKKRLAMGDDPAGELDTDKRAPQPYGRPLETVKKVRSGASGKPRYEKNADPIGGADDKGAGKNK